MISDVLSDAVSDILDYLKDDHDYSGDRQQIAEVVLAMDRLRLSPGFDTPPNGTPPTLPTDALWYLNTLLETRRREQSTDAQRPPAH
jgi:hypothetical protein